MWESGKAMTEQEFLASDDPQRMLAHLTHVEMAPAGMPARSRPRQNPLASDRKLRLFACACCRQVWDGVVCEQCKGVGDLRNSVDDGEGLVCSLCHGTGRVGGLTDPRSRQAVEVAERFADGEATEAERHDAERDIWPGDTIPSGQASLDLACQYAIWPKQRCVEYCARRVLEVLLQLYPEQAALYAALLREIIGNPWQQPRLLPSWATTIGLNPVLTWNHGTIPRLAEAIYRKRLWGEMPILADALEDAGCGDVDILAHCRGFEPCPHCLDSPGVQKVHHDTEGVSHYGCLTCQPKSGYWGTGWIPLRGPYCYGDWTLDLLLGKE